MSMIVRHHRPRHLVLGASASLALLVASMSMPVAAKEAAVNPAAFQSTEAAIDEEIGLVPELSTATTNTYRESDGSMRLESFTEPVNYLSESDEWLPIDNELVPAPGAAYEVVNAGNSFEAKIPTDPSSTPVRFATDDAWVTMRMHGLDDAPVVNGEVATFDDVSGADEVTYEVTNTGLKEDIVLAAAPSPGSGVLTYTYSLDASAGITPELNEDGAIEFRDSAGEIAVVMPAAYMFDSASPEPVTSHDVDYDLVADAAGWKLAVTPSMPWLQDTARVYPVTIDPSLGQQPASKDCWIRDTTPTGSNCGDASIYVKAGRSSGPVNYRGLLDFDTSSIPPDATVTAADVPLYLDHTQSASAVSGDYAFFRAGGVWSGSSATWNSSGASGAWVGGDPGGTAYGTLTLNGTTSGFRTFEGNLKDLVQGWVTNPQNKTGLVLKQAGTATLNVLSFYSSSTAASNDNKRPRLNVTYTLPPNQAPTVAVGIAAAPGTPPFVSSTSPTISAAAIDPEGSPVQLKFEVLDGSETAVLWNATSQTVVSGVQTSVTIPPSYLNPDDMFVVRVTATDGSAWSVPGSSVFIVEPTEEQLQTISSDDLPTVYATWESLLTCMKAEGEVPANAAVESTLGSVASNGTLVAPPAATAAVPSEACGLGASRTIKEVVSDVTVSGGIPAALMGLREELADGKLVPQVAAQAVDESVAPPPTSPTADELVVGQGQSVQANGCSVSIDIFFTLLNHDSDIVMDDFQNLRNRRWGEPTCILTWSSNGCSSIWDSGAGYDFTASCQRHDFGYRNLKRAERLYGSSPYGVHAIYGLRNLNVADEQFRRDMMAYCATRNKFVRKLFCQPAAEAYYRTVALVSNTWGYSSPMTYIKNP